MTLGGGGVSRLVMRMLLAVPVLAWAAGCNEGPEAGESAVGEGAVPHGIAVATFAEESCCDNPLPCQDGVFCNGEETCNCWGDCEPSPGPVVCDDGKACTTDMCDESAAACRFVNICDDGNPCTRNVCNLDGSCSFPDEVIPIPGCGCSSDADCADTDACTIDRCNVAAGTCNYTPQDCNDGNACTSDACNPATGCVNTPITPCCTTHADCDDSNLCTEDTCNGVTHSCTYVPAPAGTTCSDGQWCNGNEVCNAFGLCGSGSNPCSLPCQACDEPTDSCFVALGCLIGGVCYATGATNPSNQCQSCNPGLSTSSWSAKPDGTTCNDGRFCSLTDTCNGGLCAGTGDRCPVTACVTGCNEIIDACTFRIAGSPCSDGQHCNGAETCNGAGFCQSGISPCTLSCELCDEVLDTCRVAVGCRIGGACYATGATNPGNQCQWCDPVANPDAWSAKPLGAACSDGQFCTLADACNGSGSCVGSGQRCPVAGCVAGCDELMDRCLPAAAGTICSGAAGTCATDGFCDGASLTCAGGGFRPASYLCRTAAGGGCDVPEFCTGSSAFCPADAFLPASTVCRAATGACDLAENCTGTAAACPANAYRPFGTVCTDGLFCTAPDTCNGSGACVGGGSPPCSDGLWCTTDTCTEGTGCLSTLAPGACLILGVCYANGDVNPGSSCQRCWTATSTTTWSPFGQPPNDQCGGIVTIPVGGSNSSSTMCATPDYVNNPGGGCAASASAADITYRFNFTTGTDYQLFHYRVAESGNGATPHPDPFVYTRTTCGDGSVGAEWRCNDDCVAGFTGTNYASIGCNGLGALSGVTVVNPTPVGIAQTTDVMTDGYGAARGTVNTAVTRENHNNNACTGTAAYHPAPNMFPGNQPAPANQDLEWRGNNLGYANDLPFPTYGGTVVPAPCGGPFAGSCSGAGCSRTYSFTPIAGNSYTISTCASGGGDTVLNVSGSCTCYSDDGCGLLSQCTCTATSATPATITATCYGGGDCSWNYTITGTCGSTSPRYSSREALWRISTNATPPVHFFYDELALLYDGLGGLTNPFDGVIQLIGPDSTGIDCLDAAGVSAGASNYPGWGPASLVMPAAAGQRDFWLSLGSTGGEGQYSLREMIARNRFAGQHERFDPGGWIGAPTAALDLACTRLNFAPDNSVGRGHTYTMTSLGGGGACPGPFGPFSGSCSGAGCSRVYTFPTVAGNTYQIGTCGSYGGDTVVDVTGTCTCWSDDACGLGSQCSCTASSTGTATITATCYGGGACSFNYTVTTTACSTCSASWPVNPSGAAGAVVWETLAVASNYDDCSVNYPIGFNFLWGETFYSRMAVNTNGQIMLTNDPGFCSNRCFDYACADYTPDVTEHYQSYQPSISPLWTDLTMCRNWGVYGSCMADQMGRITRQVAPVAAPTGEVITATVLSFEGNGLYQGSGENINFQIILYIDGRFSLVYLNLAGSSSWAAAQFQIAGTSGTTGSAAAGTTVNFR